MSAREEVQMRFPQDIAHHVVTVKLDAPGYRHLRCQKPGTWCMGFDIVTYPGVLVFSGDMGCFVFSRLPDMFEFFRDGKAVSAPIGINPGYWSEKLLAVDGARHGGSAEEFDNDRFERCVKQDVLTWIRENRHRTTKAQRRDLWDDVNSQVIEADGDREGVRKQIAAHDFHWQAGYSEEEKRIQFSFEDFFEHNFKEYTFRFLWCCHALVWAIRHYDAITPVKEAA